MVTVAAWSNAIEVIKTSEGSTFSISISMSASANYRCEIDSSAQSSNERKKLSITTNYTNNGNHHCKHKQNNGNHYSNSFDCDDCNHNDTRIQRNPTVNSISSPNNLKIPPRSQSYIYSPFHSNSNSKSTSETKASYSRSPVNIDMGEEDNNNNIRIPIRAASSSISSDNYRVLNSNMNRPANNNKETMSQNHLIVNLKRYSQQIPTDRSTPSLARATTWQPSTSKHLDMSIEPTINNYSDITTRRSVSQDAYLDVNSIPARRSSRNYTEDPHLQARLDKIRNTEMSLLATHALKRNDQEYKRSSFMKSGFVDLFNRNK
ncbi:hypothetical protein BDB01DRAFT_832940 [Pilobolus umbonatus]|nr:hypothetical protein BDB01DRAFT_832940 [Pilobolus umbonatus]